MDKTIERVSKIEIGIINIYIKMESNNEEARNYKLIMDSSFFIHIKYKIFN